MHVVLGLLGTIVTMLILLNRLAEAGIDLGGLNPFLWQRRRAWRKKYEGNPLYQLDDPMEVTALLTIAAAKCDGDMTGEEKQLILKLFADEFHLSRKDSSALMLSSVYLLKDSADVTDNLSRVIAPGKEKFTPEQADSAVAMVSRVVDFGVVSVVRKAFLEKVRKELQPEQANNGKWARH